MNQPIEAGQLLQTEFPRDRFLIDPWLAENQICMLHSWRGTGKSFFALQLAQCLASGSSFLKWNSYKSRVLYLDAEMGLSAIKDRLEKINSSAPYGIEEGVLRFFTFEHMGGTPWNLSTKDAQQCIEKISDGVQLLIIDNLSAFTRSLPRETDKHTWYRVRDWLIKYASNGRSVLILHHTGKNGTQRGLSDYEDPLDTCIHIKTPEGHHPSAGTKFEFHFQKSQNLYGQDLESLLLELVPVDDGSLRWLWSPLGDFQAKEQEKRAKMKDELLLFGKRPDHDDEPPF